MNKRGQYPKVAFKSQVTKSLLHQAFDFFEKLCFHAITDDAAFFFTVLIQDKGRHADEAEAFLTLRETPGAASTPLLAPRTLQLLYSSLHVLPDGTPAALLLTEECTRTVYAVQLLPPFVWEDPLPPLPDCAAALTLTLTLRDVEAIDADPHALEQRLCREPGGKHWLAHPKAEAFLAGRLALLQRLYKR